VTVDVRAVITRWSKHHRLTGPRIGEVPELADPRASGLAFVLCAENNYTGPQALLFAKSLREFGGRHQAADAYVFSPRRHLALPASISRQLEDLAVVVVAEPLPGPIFDHPQGNKPMVAAWAEQNISNEAVIVVDSDGLILDEPDLEMTTSIPQVTAAWAQGVASAGPADPVDAMWRKILGKDDLPAAAMRTAVTKQLIRPYFNSGFVAARRAGGFFTRWRDEYLRLANCTELTTFLRRFSGRLGTSWRSPLFFLDQIALAATVWRHGSFNLLGERYNLPLQYVTAELISGVDRRPSRSTPVYVQYSEYLKWPEFVDLVGRSSWLPEAQVAWIRCNHGLTRAAAHPSWPPAFNDDLEKWSSNWRKDFEGGGTQHGAGRNRY